MIVRLKKKKNAREKTKYSDVLSIGVCCGKDLKLCEVAPWSQQEEEEHGVRGGGGSCVPFVVRLCAAYADIVLALGPF